MKYKVTRKNKQNQGFTLIEIIIYISLTALIMTASITTIFNSIDSSKKNEAKLDALDEINFLNQKIFLALKNSSFIYEPAIGMTKNILKADIAGYSKNPLIFNQANYNAGFLFKHFMKNSHEYIEWSVIVSGIHLASTTIEIKT